VQASAVSTRWRVLDSGAADGATNMATDVALLAHARATGEATLRLYSWSRPTLSFGRHERTRGRFDAARLASAGVDVVRRPTGGRVLLHHREVTYSITAPVADAESLRSRCDWINTRLLHALALLGVSAHSATARARAQQPGSAACFSEPNRGEIVADSRKLIASAQFVEGDAFLQHGSILLHDDQSRIAELCETPEAPTSAISLSALLGRDVVDAEVRAAVLRAFAADVEGGTTLPPARAPEHIDEDFFRDAAWIWRR
jgi:lipoate-protein ligase A